MGWTYFEKPSGMTAKDALAKEFTGCEFLATAQPTPRVMYAAMRNLKRPEMVFGIVFLLDYQQNERYNFGYKDIDESMGPCESECPDRILDLLSPTEGGEHDYAATWRERCREFNQKQRELKASQPKITDGCTVKLSRPVRFADGVERDTFRVEMDGRKVKLRGPYGGPNWFKINLRKYSYQIVG